jgi:hypothetical protein
MPKKACLLVLIAMLTMIVGGCGTGPFYLPLETRSVTLIPGVSVEKKLTGSANGKSLAFEGGGTWATGSGTQSIVAQPFLTQEARVGDATFTAPQTLDTKFNFSIYDASLRWRHFIKSGPFAYELAAGTGYSRLHYEASGGGTLGTETAGSPHLSLRIGADVRLGKSTRIEANSTGFITNSNLRDVYRNQITLVQMLGHHVAVQGGYSRLNASSYISGSSGLKTSSSGPSIGARFIF